MKKRARLGSGNYAARPKSPSFFTPPPLSRFVLPTEGLAQATDRQSTRNLSLLVGGAVSVLVVDAAQIYISTI